MKWRVGSYRWRKRVAYFMEAKWSKYPLDRSVLRELERRAEEFEWKREGERKYYIYSRSDFTFAPEEDAGQIDLPEVCDQPCT